MNDNIKSIWVCLCVCVCLCVSKRGLHHTKLEMQFLLRILEVFRKDLLLLEHENEVDIFSGLPENLRYIFVFMPRELGTLRAKPYIAMAFIKKVSFSILLWIFHFLSCLLKTTINYFLVD